MPLIVYFTIKSPWNDYPGSKALKLINNLNRCNRESYEKITLTSCFVFIYIPTNINIFKRLCCSSK